MNKKNTKEEVKIYSAGEVMSMIESFSDGMQIIAEGQSELVKKIDNIEGRFDGLEGKFDKLEIKVDKLEGKFDVLEGKFDVLEGKFDVLEGKFDVMQEDISEIKYKLNRKVDYEDFEKLEKKFVKLEKLVLSKI